MNPITTAMATFLDNLTGGSLDYKSAHPDGDSRAQAAARLFEDEGAIRPTRTPGQYIVESRRERDERGKPKLYMVNALGDVSCECEDHLTRAPHICVHIIACCWHYALWLAFATESERRAAEKEAHLRRMRREWDEQAQRPYTDAQYEEDRAVVFG
jgi:hypothetical protein